MSEYQANKIYHVGEIFTIDGCELTVAPGYSCEDCEFNSGKALDPFCNHMICGTVESMHRPSVKVVSIDDYILFRLKGKV